jgi:phage terminase large subunit-like protein
VLYQQRPIITGGGELPIEKLQTISVWNTHETSKISASCRYWDCASSFSKDASWTAGVLMHRMKDGSFVISHVAHGQWVRCRAPSVEIASAERGRVAARFGARRLCIRRRGSHPSAAR